MEPMRRRGFLAGAAAAALAGCTGRESGSTDTPADGGASTDAPTDAATATDPPTDTPADAGTPTDTATAADAGYSVRMAPVGEVTFEEPPESVAHYFPGYADMAVALGRADSINSVGVVSRYHTDVYEDLDGVSVDKDAMTELVGDSGIDMEVFIELDSDLHMIDPKWLTNNSFFGLGESDVRTITEQVAPFLGNTIFRRTDEWHTYRYYSMYEAFEKVAQAYDETERYEAFARLHDAFVADVQAKLPPADARPNGLLCFAAADEPEAFFPYRLSDLGTNKKQFHDLGITDALAGTGIDGLSTTDRGQIDYEAMLEVDPDSILLRGHETKTRAEFEDTVLAFMRDHPTASQLTAVENGAVYRGGPIYAGPIHNLFLTERFAKLYFPDVYSGELFSREEVSAVVNGET